MARQMIRLKYLCSSFSTPIMQQEVLENGSYEVYGASGFVGFLNDFYCKEPYLGIVKDGAGVGRIKQYKGETSLLGTMAYIIPNSDVDINWLKYTIMSLDLGNDVGKTTIPHIYFSDYGNRFVQHVPLEQQRKTASFLDRKCAEIDAVIERTKTTIEEYKKLKQAVITEAVTKGVRGPRPMKDSRIEWLDSVPLDWTECRIKNVIFPQEKPITESDEVITCFRDGEVTLRKNRREDGFTISFTEHGYHGVDIGDLVIHGMDAFAGAIGCSDSRGKTTPVVHVCSTAGNNRYFMYFLRSMAYGDILMDLSNGVRIRSSDYRNFAKLGVFGIVVPTIDEQNEIVDFLDKRCVELDTLIAKKTALLTELETYKKSLIYEYVTGKKECPALECEGKAT